MCILYTHYTLTAIEQKKINKRGGNFTWNRKKMNEKNISVKQPHLGGKHQHHTLSPDTQFALNF